MDGAARFNQRDSLATILITAINIVAGLLIGTLQQGIALSDAARTYTVLTVGDGLVTIIPSLLVSVAGGITLTRANSAGVLGGEIRQQLLARPATLYMASLVSAGMCLIPGLPKLASLSIAAGLFVGARRLSAQAQGIAPAELTPAEKKKSEHGQGSEMGQLLRLEDLTLEIGFQLIPLVDEKQGGQLLNRVRALRRHLTGELGFLIPPVHISDQPASRSRAEVFGLAARDQGDRPLANGRAAAAGRFGRAGSPASYRERDARAGLRRACHVDRCRAQEEQAIAAGYSVVDAVTVMTTHLGELVRRHAGLNCWAERKPSDCSTRWSDSHPKLLERSMVPKLPNAGLQGGKGSRTAAARAGLDPRHGSDSRDVA